MARRWWIYQKERFPIVAHGPLIAAFSLSTLSYSMLLRGAAMLPDPFTAAVAFISAFVFFFQLRIADEFKDFEEDRTFRPYRPVPRGLITLRGLAWVGLGTVVLQVVLALSLSPPLGVVLLAVWAYLGLMSVEFFVRDWLKRRPFMVLWTHMLIMPLIDLYVTACDWLPVQGWPPPRGLIWLLVVSFFNGVVIEIGRKLRAPEDEEPGVETYTAVWGRRRAVWAWGAALLATGLGAWQAARQINFLEPVMIATSLLFVTALVMAGRFLHHPTTARARGFEPLSGLWTLVVYLMLGVVPLFLRA